MFTDIIILYWITYSTAYYNSNILNFGASFMIHTNFVIFWV